MEEKEKNLFYMMNTAGMTTFAYWIGNYVYDWGSFFSLSAFYFVIGKALGSVVYNTVGYGEWIVVAMMWSHSLVGFSYLLASLFQSSRMASVISYVLVLVFAITTMILTGSYIHIPLGRNT